MSSNESDSDSCDSSEIGNYSARSSTRRDSANPKLELHERQNLVAEQIWRNDAGSGFHERFNVAHYSFRQGPDSVPRTFQSPGSNSSLMATLPSSGATCFGSGNSAYPPSLTRSHASTGYSHSVATSSGSSALRAYQVVLEADEDGALYAPPPQR